ncbi:MAG TPA: hypothetical protein VFS77_22820, partial [Pyrinomonadaceae bacterium]|nr:hypothetical protein [Pyrinomonadaceae bacterium]
MIGDQLFNHFYGQDGESPLYLATELYWALPQKSFEAAPPPDVRRGFASPVASESMKGCALGSGFAPIFTG